VRQAYGERVGSNKDGCSLPLSSYWSSSPLSCHRPHCHPCWHYPHRRRHQRRCWHRCVVVIVAGSSSHCASWLLCVTFVALSLCAALLSSVLSLCQLVVVCCVASAALSCCSALSSTCRLRCLCRPIMLRHLLVLLSRRRRAGCCASRCCPIILCCPLPSCQAGWFLLVVSSLLPFHLVQWASPETGIS
jgi:hypothetical protein